MANLFFHKIRRYRWLNLIGGCLCINAAYAGGEEILSTSTTFFPYTPGVSLYGFGGNGWTATGDAMAPIVGQPQNFTYVDPQIYYHNNPNDYTASVGAGQRWLNNNTTGILGVYVFGDYNHLNDGNSFWFVSPGVERLGENIDVTINRSIMFGNTVGISTDGPGTIAITNPIFFNGSVNFTDGGVVTFLDVTPSSGQTVLCLLGTCIIQ